MEDPQHIVMLEFPPDELALVRPAAYPPRKRHLVLPEGADGRRGRPRPLKRAKQEADGVLDLPVGIEDDAVILGIAEADRASAASRLPGGLCSGYRPASGRAGHRVRPHS